MFSYYGSKSKVVNDYPKPKHNLIIEPFAGSARYSLKYFENDVTLIDKYDVIIGIWKYLQQCSPKDILSLPVLPAGTKISRDEFDCIEQAWLYGFIITNGVTTPMLTVSKWGAVVMEKQIKDIAAQLYKIKHWKFICDDYQNIENQKATWFIDPPYQVGGHKYKFNKIDYSNLASWIKSRKGQVIACENQNANWMDFYQFKKMNGIKKRSCEAVWLNDFKLKQFKLTL
ncbi:DNA adenine methylase [Tenacibaculum sp. 190524A05c]|uniref:hypothetical protein n=1 Tax=Tenacibaculum platacis TaxID=3137852 RepID=UPI0031FA9128